MSITQVKAWFHRTNLQPRPEDRIHDSDGITQLLEEILEHIFGFLTFAEVKSARLVNKHWRQVATTLLRRSSKQIELNSSVAKCIINMGDGQFPVNRFLIDFYKLKQTKIHSAFSSGICDWVKELTLSVHIHKLSAVQVYLVTFPTENCVYKDLTHFNLKIIQGTDLFRKSWKRFTDFVLRSILQNSPNLVEVNVVYEFSGAKGAEKLAVCPVVENLFPISNSVGTSKLSYINFEKAPLELIDLAKWSTLNLKLRKLGLNVARCSKTNELLAKFVETQTRTLKQLTLNLSHQDFKPPAMTFTFTFPRLEKLEQLRMTCKSSYAVVTFPGIDYARLFPCLKKLDLLKFDAKNWRDFLGNDLLEPTNTVEELIFPRHLYNNVDLPPNPAVIAAKVFTGLKKLEIFTDRDFTEVVYQNMPNLEVVSLFQPFEKYDHIITGLQIAKCRNFMGVMTETWIKELQNAERRSMARLQNLKTLTLSCRVFGGDLSITRLSIHVLKKMSSLKCVDLFHGCAYIAELFSAKEDGKQILEELRANFVVL